MRVRKLKGFYSALASIIPNVLDQCDNITLHCSNDIGDVQGTLLMVTAALALWNAAIVPATLAHG